MSGFRDSGNEDENERSMERPHRKPSEGPAGKSRIKGTRIPVSLILGCLAGGYNPEQIIAEFPDLNHEQIAACLDDARAVAEFEVAI
jgi:uncharacterized protein (DUF433 family)